MTNDDKDLKKLLENKGFDTEAIEDIFWCIKEATPQQPSEPLEEKKYLDSCDAYEYVKAIVSNYSEDEARRRINSFLHRDVDCEKPQEPLKDSATTECEKLIEKVKVYEDALWVITTDFHEDNPDRHINPDTEWRIAERALQKTGAMKK